MRFRLYIGVLAAGLALRGGPAIRPALAGTADRCTTADQPINTDRPDVANSSVVVPTGSLQSENGVDVAGQAGDRGIDGPDSRLRFGLAPCLEVLVDLPNYVAASGHTPPIASGFTDVAPAIKWQISPDPGNFDLAVTFGAALPTGRAALAGSGLQPYLQLPWSKDLTGGWELTGMLTFFTYPADPQNKLTTETTLGLAKELSERLEVFTEYAGDFAERERSRQMINSGVLWRVTKTQQLDMHLGFGLNSNSPNLTLGFGYSFRIDGLLQ
jgi:Putative MetA-pathway of phenol degradation